MDLFFDLVVSHVRQLSILYLNFILSTPFSPTFYSYREKYSVFAQMNMMGQVDVVERDRDHNRRDG